MKGKLFKTGISMLLASAMMITSIPASPLSAAGPAEKATPILDSAIVTYDFEDWSAVSGDDGKLVNGDKQITLESFGGCEKPKLVQDEKRGQVLSLKEQGIADNGVDNRGDALLPENPFAGKPIDNGFTLNFWTQTTGNAAGNRTLVDFEVAPQLSEKRAGTLAVNQQMVYWNITDQKEATFADFNVGNLNLKKENGWKMVTMALTKDSIAFYADGEKIEHTVQSGSADYEEILKELAGSSGIFAANEETKVRLGASMAKYWIGAGALMDEISFFGKALTDTEVKALYQETLIPVALQSVKVTGSKTVGEDKKIQLKAELTPADTTVDRTVTWKSSNEEILTVDMNGKVLGIAPGKANVIATVAGVDSDPFEVTVEHIEYITSLDSGYYLTAYSTEKNFYDSWKSNVDEETRSVYFAVSKDGKNFEALNNGGGVIFPTKGSRKITEPRVSKEGAKFVVQAQDVSTSQGYHKFVSEDGVVYQYDGELIKTVDAISAPLRKSNFKLILEGKNILEEDDTISLGNALKLTEQEYNNIVNKLGTVVNTGLETLADVTVNQGDDILKALQTQRPSVNATYNDGSTQKFNIDWKDAVKNVSSAKPGVYELTGKVQQTKYLNNLKAINGSTLMEDDPRNTNPNEPDHYNEETGEVYYDETKFVEGMADPMIYWDEKTSTYYMTGSYFPEDADKNKLPGDNTQQYDRVVLRTGKTLEELQDRSRQVTIWKVGNQGFEDNAGNTVSGGQRYIWAPEIHRIGNNWVVYFTEAHKGGNEFNIYSHALVLDGNKDPYQTALKAANGVSEWKDYQMRGGTGLTKAITSSFCLDMTYFKDEVNKESYVIWASKAYGESALYLAKVNEEKPWELNSEIITLTAPEYGWERVDIPVNEGPTVLQKDGKIFMCFSAAATGSEYAIGMMTAKAGDNLLDIKNWTKNPYPLLSSHDVSGEEGPGHNSFTVDKDGNAIFVYHARPTSHNYQHCGWDGNKSLHYNGQPLNDPCRHARLKRVHWAADGTPILKMTYDNELTAENQTVKVKVTVKEKTETTPTTPEVKSLKLNVKKLTLGVKEKTYQLKATVNPKGTKVTFTSDKPGIVAVGKTNGKLNAKKTGKAVITAKAGNKSAKVTVTVKKAPTKKTKVTVKKKVTMKLKGKNKTYQLKPKVSSQFGSATFKYTIDKKGKKVVKVDKNGKVTAKKKGTATITVKTYNGKAKAAVKITVK